MAVKVGNSWVSETALTYAKAKSGSGTSVSLKALSDRYPGVNFTTNTQNFSQKGTNNIQIAANILVQMQNDPDKRVEYEALIYDCAQLVYSEGEIFMHPLETRDVAAASIIRECTARGKGVKALDGVALWLDTPLIEMLHGEGTIAKRIPGMLRMYAKLGIDLRKEPILIYPTLHYQNGGILIDKDAETKLPGLFVAGEAVGGIHGTNRLMGNSLLDIIVFGRIAGTKAAEAAKAVKLGKLSLEHVRRYAEEEKAAGVQGELSPKLLPVYTHGRDVR